MSEKSKKPGKFATFSQILICFVIPIVILAKFSGEDQLGAVKGLLLALALPIIYELISFARHRKPSYTTLLAIGGILVTGGISLLGLSEDWLALRRSVPYLAGAIAILISIWIKRPLVDIGLKFILDMDSVNKKAREYKSTKEVSSVIKLSSYLFVILLIILAVSSFVLTKMVINSPTDTSQFNQEYASLKIISLAASALPLLVGVTGILFYLVSALEKLTKLSFEDILKKK